MLCFDRIDITLRKQLSQLAGMVLIVAALGHSQMALGSAITWNQPITVSSPSNISFPTGATVHIAADFNTVDGFGPGPVNINGIDFTAVGPTGIAGRLTHSLSDGPNFGAAAFPGGTGNTGLDNLLNSHSWDAGDPNTASVSLQGLTVGAPYQIQVIGAVDTRDCCLARVYEPDNGQGVGSPGTELEFAL